MDPGGVEQRSVLLLLKAVMIRASQNQFLPILAFLSDLHWQLDVYWRLLSLHTISSKSPYTHDSPHFLLFELEGIAGRVILVMVTAAEGVMVVAEVAVAVAAATAVTGVFNSLALWQLLFGMSLHVYKKVHHQPLVGSALGSMSMFARYIA